MSDILKILIIQDLSGTSKQSFLSPRSGLCLTPRIFYNPHTPSGFGSGWSIPSDRGHYCGLILSSCDGKCDVKDNYLLRGFGIFSQQTAVIIANNHLLKSRRTYIIIANIKSEIANSE